MRAKKVSDFWKLIDPLTPLHRLRHSAPIIHGLRSVVFIQLGLISLMSQPVHSQGQSIYENKAAALVESYVRSDLFSGSVLVAHDGQPLFRKSFGEADREWEIPNAPDTKFRIGSVTKQFTAAAILQLVERGKVKLDDPISEYYTDAPAAWQKVTICHLLSHTSGIPSYTALPDSHGKISKVGRTPQEIIQLTQNEPLEFEPGAQFAYDNTGYILLGYVIEKVTGRTYGQYLHENIFGPLDMHDRAMMTAQSSSPAEHQDTAIPAGTGKMLRISR